MPHCDDCGPIPRTNFYVSVISGTRKGMLAGPYGSHADALAKVNNVRTLARDADPRADWYFYGTAGSDDVFKTVFGIV